jgi:hypothetical protein
MKRKYRTHLRKVHTLADLHAEKIRLKTELKETEENISAEYHHIREALSLRNIFSTAIHDIEVTSTLFSKVFSVGKSLLGKVKKKKKKGHDHDGENAMSSEH